MKRILITLLFILIAFQVCKCNEDLAAQLEMEINGSKLEDNAPNGNEQSNEQSDQGDFIEQKQEIQEEIEQEQVFHHTTDNTNVDIEEDLHIDINLSDENIQAKEKHETQKLQNQEKVDIIALEIQQLQSLIELHKSKLNLLSNLRENMIKNNITFQEFNTTLLKKKSQTSQSVIDSASETDNEESIQSKISSIYQSNTKKIKIRPQKMVELQQYTFSNRLDKKFTVKIPQKVLKVKNLQTFQYVANNGVKSNLMLASLASDSSILIHDFSGEMATDPYSPGHRIHLMAVSQRQDDVFVATIGDDFYLRIAKIDNQKVKSQFAVGDNQFRYKMKTDQQIPLDSIAQLGGIEDQIQTLEYIQYQSQKNFLLGDKDGYIHVYNKNGTFITKELLSDQRLPILQFQKLNAPSILFYTQNEIGFFNLNTNKKSMLTCPTTDLQILKVKTDPFASTLIYALTQNQQIVVYDFKVMEEMCKQKEFFDFDSQIQEDEDDEFNINKQLAFYNNFVPIRNFILLVSNSSNKLRVLNITDIASEGIQDGFDLHYSKLFENLNLTEGNIQFIQQQKIYLGNYVIAGYSQNKGEATTYSLYEIVVPQNKDFDFLSQIRGPLIITVIIGIISFQVWKNYKSKQMYKKNKNEYGGFKKDLDIPPKSFMKKGDIDSNSSQMNSYKEKLSQLEESTNQLLKNTKNIEQKQKGNQKKVNFEDLDDYDEDDSDQFRKGFNPSNYNQGKQRVSSQSNNNSRYNNYDDYNEQMDDEMDIND